MAEQWQVKRENAPGSGRFTTLFEGDEYSAREYIVNNFPRPHVVLGQDEPRADVQLHGPDGERHEFHGATGTSPLHGVAALSGSTDAGWKDLNDESIDTDTDDDNDDDDTEVTL